MWKSICYENATRHFSHQLQRFIHLVWDVRNVINDNIKENGQTPEPYTYLKGEKRIIGFKIKGSGSKMKDILVIGATGKQGNAVVKQLLEDGWYVSALTRNKNNRKLSDIGHPHLSIVEGDLSDSVSLQSAMKGKYGLYSIQPIVKDDVNEELRQGMKIIEIAEQENIQHIVYSTAGGVNRNRTGPHFEVLAKIENRLMESNINATVIKPSFLWIIFTHC